MHYLILVVILFMPGALYAQAQPIDLPRALQLTLSGNPELAAYPFRKNQSEALRLQAGLRPQPQIGLALENAFGSGFYEGTDFSETTLTLSQVIELGGKRDLRLTMAEAQAHGLEAEYELARLDVLAETSRRYYELLRLQDLQALVARLLERERLAVEAIGERVQAGRAAQVDASLLELRLVQSEALAEQLQLAHRSARLQLAAMWLSPPDFERAAGSLAIPPGLPTEAQVLAALESAPQLLQALSLVRISDAEMKLVEAEGRPDLTVDFGVRHLEDTSDQALVMGVSMPLSFKNPNRGRVQALAQQRALNQQQADVTQRELQLRLLDMRLQFENLYREAITIEERVMPRALALLEHSRSAYRDGGYTVLDWADAQVEHYVVERDLIELKYAALLQLLELERITGLPMTATTACEGC